jgi:iron(III) transport system ATP-binding protein
MALSDRIVVMDFGAKVQQDDTPVNTYLHPANKYVYGFIGLSNFLRVEMDGGGVYLQGARDAGPVAGERPPTGLGPTPTLACRPGEIELTAEGGVRGRITRRTLLGDIIDYRVQVGPQEVRVQRSVRLPLFAEGAPCGLVLQRLHWYAE